MLQMIFPKVQVVLLTVKTFYSINPKTLINCTFDLCSLAIFKLLLIHLSVLSVEKKERARLKTVKFNAKSRVRGVSTILQFNSPF